VIRRCAAKPPRYNTEATSIDCRADGAVAFAEVLANRHEHRVARSAFHAQPVAQPRVVGEVIASITALPTARNRPACTERSPYQSRSAENPIESAAACRRQPVFRD
jgi:hypothetical protein